MGDALKCSHGMPLDRSLASIRTAMNGDACCVCRRDMVREWLWRWPRREVACADCYIGHENECEEMQKWVGK